MARAGLNRQLIIEMAVRLVDEHGMENLSLALLAKALKVRSPSLYNHIDGLDGVKEGLLLYWLDVLGRELQHAVMGRAGSEALVAVAHAYRNTAKRHPSLYPLSVGSVEGASPAIKQAGQAVLEVILAVLRGYHLTDEAALHGARCLRSTLHGFVSLETGGGFGIPLDVDESFEQLIFVIDQGLANFDLKPNKNHG
ncbi:TetR-like C-terminal domain-containing protein [Anaerolineales bacterium HSG25]|nr:TetR-like C-terminal domain-containing protein [Anaerolineales bacterium HSG25]